MQEESIICLYRGSLLPQQTWLLLQSQTCSSPSPTLTNLPSHYPPNSKHLSDQPKTQSN